MTAINDEKKRVKKIMSEPVTRFENDVKELLAMCESVSSAIDVQIKAFEEGEAKPKKPRLRRRLTCCICEIARYASFDEVFDPPALAQRHVCTEGRRSRDCNLCGTSRNGR